MHKVCINSTVLNHLSFVLCIKIDRDSVDTCMECVNKSRLHNIHDSYEIWILTKFGSTLSYIGQHFLHLKNFHMDTFMLMDMEYWIYIECSYTCTIA